MLRFRKGFTLIELIMVIVIIGILAAIAVPRFVNLRQQARQAQCEGSAGAIRAALSNYYAWWSTNSAHYLGGYPANISVIGHYFQDDTPPSDPGWTNTSTNWESYYTAGTSGILVAADACNIANF